MLNPRPQTPIEHNNRTAVRIMPLQQYFLVPTSDDVLTPSETHVVNLAQPGNGLEGKTPTLQLGSTDASAVHNLIFSDCLDCSDFLEWGTSIHKGFDDLFGLNLGTEVIEALLNAKSEKIGSEELVQESV